MGIIRVLGVWPKILPCFPVLHQQAIWFGCWVMVCDIILVIRYEANKVDFGRIFGP